jgi:SAM-dependent methyltransferase
MGTQARPALIGSALLTSEAQVEEAERWARMNGLGEPTARSKYWDNVLALKAIQTMGIRPDEPIADLGCRNSIVFAWLHAMGYRRLWGCDLTWPYLSPLGSLRRGRWKTAWQYARALVVQRSRLSAAALEDSGLPGGHFAAVTCMSVIEHGVDVPRFFREAVRLLRPGGLLLLSTDYWPEPIDMGGLKRYARASGNDRVFDRAGARELCNLGTAAGLELLGEPPLDVSEPVVHHDGRSYTFLFLAFRKHSERLRS